jgi:uncharacterized protein (TIGR02145 family)
MKNFIQNKYSKISIITFLFLLTGSLYLNSQATNFTWLQNSWIGGQAGTTATHSTDANGTWTNYSTKDSDLNINGSGDAQLKKADNWQETSDADFNANTSKDSTLAVSGNSIKLLKADGASCSAAGECQGGLCTGNICVTPFSCNTSTVSYGGQTYNTVQIGAQCWFRQNLNAGTMLASASTMPADPAPTLNTPSTVSKWCYNNDSAICDTDGGLYTWAEANALASTCNTASCTPSTPNQGICPTGWHIPTQNEYTALERTICTSGTCATDFPLDATTVGWRGTDEGSKLSNLTLNGNNSSGFSGLLAGCRNTDSTFCNLGAYGYFWSSTQDAVSTNAWRRTLSSGYANVYRYYYPKTAGFSVRCIKNTTPPLVTTNSTTSIASYSASGNGNVTDVGGENPTRSIEWGTVSGTYTNSCTAGTGGTGTYSCSLTGLTPSTTYYVRAKAVNSAGTSYGSETSFATPAFACGTSTVSYGGQTYNTVQIGSQCWFKENLNVGNMLASAATMPANPAPTLNDPNTVSKWCYNNDTNICNTDGGLYTWAEANALASTCNTTSCAPSTPNQGICPTGWHIPTHDEYTTLERAVCTSGTCNTDFPFDTTTTGWRGTNEGSKISTLTLNGNNSSSFTALLTGARADNNTFFVRGSATGLWSSSQNTTSLAWRRVLDAGYATIYRVGYSKVYGLSVRCVQN